MSLTAMQLEQAIERAQREGRSADVDKLRFLLAEVTGEAVVPTTRQTYTMQEGDDVFGVSETYLGGLEYVPDFLAANPESGFTVGEEVVLPEVEKAEDPLSAQLVTLFETKGPPNANWTAEDYALLEAVQARVVGPGGDPAGGSGSGGASGGQSGKMAVDDEEDTEETETRIPDGTADFELPAEDAEVIAQFMAQMIINGVVPDGSAWGPQRREDETIAERDKISETESGTILENETQEDGSLANTRDPEGTPTPDWTPVPVATPIPAAQTTPTSGQEGGEPPDYSNLSGPAVCETTSSCPPKDPGLDWSDPATHLKWFARGFYGEDERIRYDEGLTDLEVMAQIVEEAADIYGGESWDTGILNGLTEIFTGRSDQGPLTLLKDAAARYANKFIEYDEGSEFLFGDSGFHPDFQDKTNQISHFWPYLVNSADSTFPGSFLASMGNHFHEMVQGGPGASANDYVLSVAAIEIGLEITNDKLTPAQLAERLRKDLGADGVGSDGLIDRISDAWPTLLRHNTEEGE